MKFKLVGVGEVLWDLLPNGPELGGAPSNFAYHAHALGADSLLISRIGNDPRGREILRRFRQMDLSTEGLQTDSQAPTGTASVAVERDGVAHFVIHENVAWDWLNVTREGMAAAREADAICFGTLAQRREAGRKAVRKLVNATPQGALRVFDINLRQKYYSRELIEESLQLSNVLKLNIEELETLVEILGLRAPTQKHANNERSTKENLEKLATRFRQKLIALTRGSNGSLLYCDGNWAEYRSSPVQIVDTVGAGDSFTAALVLGVLNDMSLDQTNAVANEVARYVCSQSGATPPMPASFAERFNPLKN